MQKFCGNIGVFYFGLAVEEKNGEWFHVLENGMPAYPQRYKMAEYFQREGDLTLAWVKTKEGKWIKINPQGKEIEMQNTSTAKQQ